MELRHLRAFLAVADLGGFTRAAEHLGFTQPAISAQIHQLEAEVGHALFHRDGKQVHLTEAGQVLHQYARTLVDVENSAQEALAAFDTRPERLRVGGSESVCSFLLPPVLTELHRRFPDLEVLVETGLTQSLVSAVAQDALDACIVAGPQQQAGLHYKHLRSEALVLVAAPSHPLASLARTRALVPADLLSVDLIGFGPACPYQARAAEALQRAGLAHCPKLNFSSIGPIKRYLLDGKGAAMVPRLAVAGELETEALVELQWTTEPVMAEIGVVYRRGRSHTAAMRALLTLLDHLSADEGTAAG